VFNPITEHFPKTPQSYLCNSFVCRAGRFMAGICINIYTLQQGRFGGRMGTRVCTHMRTHTSPSPRHSALCLGQLQSIMNNGHPMPRLSLRTSIKGQTGPQTTDLWLTQTKTHPHMHTTLQLQECLLAVLAVALNDMVFMCSVSQPLAS
jgi:hypothetical protein